MPQAARIAGERREYPRVELRCPARVRTAEGGTRTVGLEEVSPRGLRFHCTREIAHELHPSGRYITDENAPEVEMQFVIPFGQPEPTVSVRGRLVRLKVQTEGSIEFGVRFEEFLGDTLATYDRFLEQVLLPADTGP